MKLKYTWLGLLILPFCLSGEEVVKEDKVEGIFQNGKISVAAQIRYEFAEIGTNTVDDGFSARIRYGFETAPLAGFTFMIEGETVEPLSNDADVNDLDLAGQGSELNQLWIGYAYEKMLKLKVGRQVFTQLDHRFFGHVGWRQNIQTFDGIFAQVKPLEKLTTDLFFLNKVNRVNGVSNDMDTLGIQGTYALNESLKITGFAYRIQIDPEAGSFGSAASNDTLGVRMVGTQKVADIPISYIFSYAYQEDNDRSPVAFDADYWLFEFSTQLSGIKVTGGLEMMGDGFRTPLATVHKFAGFADVFAVPSLAGGLTEGLNDYYLTLGYKVPVGSGINLNLGYHYFETSSGNSLGDEIDFVVNYSFNKYVNVLAKVALYNEDSAGSGVPYGGQDKDLISLEVNFQY